MYLSSTLRHEINMNILQIITSQTDLSKALAYLQEHYITLFMKKK